MSMFDVPGWSTPSTVQPMSDSRKRKRPGTAGDSSSDKLQSAGVNMEKLMKTLGNEGRKSQVKEKKADDEGDKSARRNDKKRTLPEVNDAYEHGEIPSARLLKGKRERPKKRSKGNADASGTVHRKNEETVRKDKKAKEGRRADIVSQTQKEHHQAEGPDAQLTSLQVRMKQSLEGARFRWINETLYKSSSKDAERLMRKDPKVFEEYHVGFRHQVTSWPSNPVEHFIETLSSYPERTVIVDLGCGDAALAQALVPKGFTVLSYDLVAANSFIVATDICDKLPIPGAEDGDDGQIVDIVVCSLSLMSTNWLNCIREARRILKTGGELKIAEVASRFTNIEGFTSLVSSVGFRLASKDARNSHFTLFDFKKSDSQRSLGDKAWKKMTARGDVLQPCEYKRR